jgi:FAD/FMN-containing dehydrogenase
VKAVPRGAGTSLSGGAVPLEDGVLLGLGRFNRILEIAVPARDHQPQDFRHTKGEPAGRAGEP